VQDFSSSGVSRRGTKEKVTYRSREYREGWEPKV